MTKDFNQSSNTPQRDEEEERSSKKARPRPNRESLDRGWKDGSKPRHADYQRANQGPSQQPNGNYRAQGPSRHAVREKGNSSYKGSNDQEKNGYRDRNQRSGPPLRERDDYPPRRPYSGPRRSEDQRGGGRYQPYNRQAPRDDNYGSRGNYRSRDEDRGPRSGSSFRNNDDRDYRGQRPAPRDQRDNKPYGTRRDYKENGNYPPRHDDRTQHSSPPPRSSAPADHRLSSPRRYDDEQRRPYPQHDRKQYDHPDRYDQRDRDDRYDQRDNRYDRRDRYDQRDNRYDRRDRYDQRDNRYDRRDRYDQRDDRYGRGPSQGQSKFQSHDGYRGPRPQDPRKHEQEGSHDNHPRGGPGRERRDDYEYDRSQDKKPRRDTRFVGSKDENQEQIEITHDDVSGTTTLKSHKTANHPKAALMQEEEPKKPEEPTPAKLGKRKKNTHSSVRQTLYPSRPGFVWAAPAP